jgi:hypothetical protein
MTDIFLNERAWLHTLFGAALLVSASATVPLSAQGLESEQAIDKIIGSEVQQEEQSAEADAGRIIAAIDKTVENTETVRKTSNLDKVDIVFLPDAVDSGPPAEVEAKLKEREREIVLLRQELEGNAMLYHAINSRSVMMRDVLAVEFDGSTSVTIFAAAKPAN